MCNKSKPISLIESIRKFTPKNFRNVSSLSSENLFPFTENWKSGGSWAIFQAREGMRTFRILESLEKIRKRFAAGGKRPLFEAHWTLGIWKTSNIPSADHFPLQILFHLFLDPLPSFLTFFLSTPDGPLGEFILKVFQ